MYHTLLNKVIPVYLREMDGKTQMFYHRPSGKEQRDGE